MNFYEIPLLALPQLLSVQLGATTYQLNIYWSKAAQCWVLDILDTSANTIVGGLNMVTGVDLLGQLGYLGIGGSLFLQSGGADPLVAPTFENLGQSVNLYFIPFAQ